MNSIEELRYLILAAQREGDRLLSVSLEPLGLTTSQAEVLRVLHDYAPLSLIELGERLVCETGSPSRLVNMLVEKCLVERKVSELDRRRVNVSLDEINKILWRFIDGRPTSKALMHRRENS